MIMDLHGMLEKLFKFSSGYVHYYNKKSYSADYTKVLSSDGSIELTFEFDQIRNFSYMELWAYGSSLRTTEITFCTDGKNFSLSSQISSIQVFLPLVDAITGDSVRRYRRPDPLIPSSQ